MDPVATTLLTAEQRREVDEWIEAHLPELPEPVAAFLNLHRHYLTAGEDLPQRFKEVVQELLRALGITSSSERRRSGSPVSAVAGTKCGRAKTERERLEQQRDRCCRLGDWHRDLHERHTRRATRIKERLVKMKTKPAPPVSSKADDPEPSSPASLQDIIDDTPVESIELTEEERAEIRAQSREFADRVEEGEQADPALMSSTEIPYHSSCVLLMNLNRH